MLSFHANLYARPAGLALGAAILLRGAAIRPLEWSDPSRVFRRALPLSFDQAVARLLALDGVDVEPDGFLVAAGRHGEGPLWRVRGQLFEFNESLHRVTLHGTCPAANFDLLVGCFRDHEADARSTALVYELVEEGVVLCEDEFRRWAAAPGGKTDC